MRRPEIRAVVLAAGRGERLRPLTALLPKPLLPVLGRPVIEHTLRHLAALGVERAAVNLHHRGEAIQARLGGALAGVALTYSPEEELLGTLGALFPLQRFLAPADLVLVVNGDSLCRWPFKGLVRAHLRSGADATLLLARRGDARRFGGGVSVGEKGRILSLRGDSGTPGPGERRLVFAGAHLFAPDLLEGSARAGGGFADFIGHLYEPLLARGAHLQGFETGRHWHDLGTPRRYLAAARDWARGRWPRRWFRSSWIAPGAEVGRGAMIQRSVVEAGARIEAGSRLEGSLVLSRGRVRRGSRVVRSIVGPRAEIPSGTVVERRMVTRARSDVPLRPEDSKVGEHVYSRLEPRRGEAG